MSEIVEPFRSVVLADHLGDRASGDRLDDEGAHRDAVLVLHVLGQRLDDERLGTMLVHLSDTASISPEPPFLFLCHLPSSFHSLCYGRSLQPIAHPVSSIPKASTASPKVAPPWMWENALIPIHLTI